MTETLKPLPPHLQSNYINASGMDWKKSEFPGISMKILFADEESGMSTILFKMEPGAVVPPHEHTALEQTYVLSGSLEDAEGKATEGNFVWRPAGNTHTAYSPNGAVILSLFMKPNRFFEGTKFFTEL